MEFGAKIHAQVLGKNIFGGKFIIVGVTQMVTGAKDDEVSPLFRIIDTEILLGIQTAFVRVVELHIPVKPLDGGISQPELAKEGRAFQPLRGFLFGESQFVEAKAGAAFPFKLLLLFDPFKLSLSTPSKRDSGGNSMR
jgi:hypothetical protein